MSKKVMIVEDNELNLKLFTDLLRAHQFTVEGVRDGRIKRGQLLLLEAFGGGFTWGSALVRY